jgi:hypothetical protein
MKWLCKKVYEVIETETEFGITEERGNLIKTKVVRANNDIPRGTKIDQEFFHVEGVETKHPKLIQDEEGNFSVIEDDKPKRKKNKQKKMRKDVYAGMESTFGFDSDITVMAQSMTWEAMVKRPANYISAALGLNTEAEVAAYATSKLNSADAYAVYRLELMKSYQDDIETIDNEWRH